MSILLITGLVVLPIFNIILSIGTYKHLAKTDIQQIRLMYTLYNIIVIISYAILTVLFGYILLLTSGDVLIAKEMIISFSTSIINIFIYSITKILIAVRTRQLRKAG